MSGYITKKDITDQIVQDFNIDVYLAETDNEVNDLAEQFGLEPEDICTDPLHYKVKRYAISYCLMRFCQDKIGTNTIESPEFEKYAVKHRMYEKDYENLRGQISYAMISGSVDEMRDRVVNIATIFRG